jgi:hypothetical protein
MSTIGACSNEIVHDVRSYRFSSLGKTRTEDHVGTVSSRLDASRANDFPAQPLLRLVLANKA